RRGRISGTTGAPRSRLTRPTRVRGGAPRGRRGRSVRSSRCGSAASAWSQFVRALGWAPYVTTVRGAMLMVRWWGRESCVLERLSEVFPEVFDVLEADREADEVLRDTVALVAGARLDQGLDPAERGRVRDHPRRALHRARAAA